MTEVSYLVLTITRSGAIPPVEPEVRLINMENTQHDVRVSEDVESEQRGGARTRPASAATVARPLANPRRVRRN